MYSKTKTEPDTPAPPILINATSHTIEVTWIKPRTNGSEIVHYTLKWIQEDHSDTIVILARSIATNSYTISNLRAGKVRN